MTPSYWSQYQAYIQTHYRTFIDGLLPLLSPTQCQSSDAPMCGSAPPCCETSYSRKGWRLK